MKLAKFAVINFTKVKTSLHGTKAEARSESKISLKNDWSKKLKVCTKYTKTDRASYVLQLVVGQPLKVRNPR